MQLKTQRHVYFILSHTNVAQLVRLVGVIRELSPTSLVLIHHDGSKTALPPDSFGEDHHVLVIERWLRAGWGQFSLVDIVRAGLAELRDRNIAYEWIVLLSGMDYPIRPLRDFEEALETCGDGMLYHDPEPGQLLDRYRFAWYRLPRFLENGLTHRMIGRLAALNRRQNVLRFQSGRVGCRIGIRSTRSPLPDGMRFYKGTQWWALSAAAIRHAERFMAEHPGYVRWFARRTLVPDEAFFHTMLLNARHLSFRNNDGRFVRFATPTSASPETLRADDVPEVLRSGRYFARKFDVSVDARPLDELDAVLLARS